MNVATFERENVPWHDENKNLIDVLLLRVNNIGTWHYIPRYIMINGPFLILSAILIQTNKLRVLHIPMSSLVSRTDKRVCQSLKGITTKGGSNIQSETVTQMWADLFSCVHESTPFRVHWFQGDTISLQSRKRIFTYSSKNSVEFYSFLY